MDMKRDQGHDKRSFAHLLFGKGFLYALVCYVAVVLVQFKAYVVAVGVDTGDCGCSAAHKAIENGIAGVAPRNNVIVGKAFRELCGVTPF